MYIRIAHRQQSLPCQGSAAFAASMGNDGGIFIRHQLLDTAFQTAAGEEGALWDMPGIPLLFLSDIEHDNQGSSSQLGLQMVVWDFRDGLSGRFRHFSSSESHQHTPLGYVRAVQRRCITHCISICGQDQCPLALPVILRSAMHRAWQSPHDLVQSHGLIA